MVNKVDMSEIENFSNDLKAASADIKSSLNKVEEQIEQINSMRFFSGKAAKSAKQYFGDIHLTILESFKGLFEDLEENLHQHMKTFESKVDASDSAVIRSNYLQDVREDINETFEDLKKQDEIIHETIEDISDISSATPTSFSDVDEWKKEAVKKVKELEEDLDAFTGADDETDIKKLMQKIEAVMNKSKTSEEQARFADFKGATKGSSLAKLKEYNQAKMKDEEKKIEQLNPQSQAYLEQAQADYDKKEIDKATFEAIRLGVIQNGSSYIKSASNGKHLSSVSEQVEDNISQWASKIYPNQLPNDNVENLNNNQAFMQNMINGHNVDAEEEVDIISFLEEGDFDGGYNPDSDEYPEEEPLGFWNKRELVGGSSPLAGTPDGLAGPTTAGLNFMFDDVGTILDNDASVQEKMLAGSFMFVKPLKLADKGHDLYKTSHHARKSKNINKGKEYKNYKTVEYNGYTKINGEVRNTSRRVFQRKDIDYNRVDPKTGKTNLQLMKNGRPPVWKDGSKIELHHLIQKEPGSMVELPSSMHKEYDKILHGLVKNGGSFRNDPVLKKQYQNFRLKYWRLRAKQKDND